MPFGPPPQPPDYGEVLRLADRNALRLIAWAVVMANAAAWLIVAAAVLATR